MWTTQLATDQLDRTGDFQSDSNKPPFNLHAIFK